MAVLVVPKVIIFAYSIEDDFSILIERMEPLLTVLCRQKFALGFEKLSSASTLDEQIISIDTRIAQVKALADQAFQFSWEQLLAASATSGPSTPKALKPLIHRAKILAFQQVVFETLQKSDVVPFFGLDENPSAHSLRDCFSTNAIEWSALFMEKARAVELANTLKPLKMVVETFFLASPNSLNEREEIIPSTPSMSLLPLSKMALSSWVTSFMQQACQSLNEQARLLVSMRSIGHTYHRGHFSALHATRHPLPADQAKPTSSEASLSSRMKQALQEFRGVFNEGSAGGATTTTIVGNRESNTDE